jgi:hypothetical protein
MFPERAIKETMHTNIFFLKFAGQVALHITVMIRGVISEGTG